MTKFQSLSLLLVGLLLGGCADLAQLTGSSDVPIEERGATTTAGAAGTAATTTPAAGSQAVETLALPAAGGAEAHAMPAAAVPSTIGSGRAVGVTPEPAAMLRDPAYPLSTRGVYFD
ncbi:MAG: hypothetical protein HGA75_13010, partial [Thiobacillus sp.]|nr:hypothetical protein [Thiobacillus sp.]